MTKEHVLLCPIAVLSSLSPLGWEGSHIAQMDIELTMDLRGATNNLVLLPSRVGELHMCAMMPSLMGVLVIEKHCTASLEINFY